MVDPGLCNSVCLPGPLPWVPTLRSPFGFLGLCPFGIVPVWCCLVLDVFGSVLALFWLCLGFVLLPFWLCFSLAWFCFGFVLLCFVALVAVFRFGFALAFVSHCFVALLASFLYGSALFWLVLTLFFLACLCHSMGDV